MADTTTFRFRPEMPTEASRASVLDATDALGGVAELYLYDPIDSWGGYWGVSAKEFAEALAALPEDVNEIRLHINSPGGEVWDAMAIVNQLRRHQARVVAIVDGIAASAASVIAVTADETIMGVGAQMMIHDAWTFAMGNEADMQATATRLSKDSDAIARIYAAKAGGEPADWRDLMRAESWFFGSEAVDAGLADRTVDDTASDAKASVLPMWRYRGRAQAPVPRIPGRSAAALTHAPVSTEPGTTNRKESDMSDKFMAGLRERLGITDAGIDDDGILAALDEALAEQAETPPNPPTALPDGVVAIEQGVLDALRVDAEEGRAARQRETDARRGAIVDEAIQDGRVPLARRDHWVAALAVDEEGNAAVLASLPKGLIPVTEIGFTGGIEESSEDALYSKAWGTPAQKEA